MDEPFLERRRFRRTEGVLYFALLRKGEETAVGPLQEDKRPLKLVQVMLQNFASYVNYRNPADIDIYQQCIRVMEELLLQIELSSEKKGRQLQYCHQPAIISGDAFEFATFLPFTLGDRVELHLCFPIYPFTSIVLQSCVIKTKAHSGISGDRRIVLQFIDITADAQEQLTRYVASREREIIRQRKVNSLSEPTLT